MDFFVVATTPSQGRVWLQSLSTRSVALIAQVTKFRSLPSFFFFLSLRCYEGELPLDKRRQGSVSVQSVISIPFIAPVIWWILLFYSP